MDLERIKARREKIEQDAPCVGCGATRALCLASRGKDPTAPAWFGCCARGTAAGPCEHRVSSKALLDLIKEIERGEVAPVEDDLLASIQEFPRMSRGRSLQYLVNLHVMDSWPDDVPMEF